MNSALQVIVRQFGGPDVLELVEVPVPVPGANQLLVRVEAAGVLFGDVMRRTDRYLLPTPLPYEPGTEIAGTVVATGPGVTTHAAGDRIVSRVPSGGYAQYALATASHATRLPHGVSFADATVLLAQGMTAWLLTHETVDLRDKSVFIESAAGGVGSLMVQLARRQGARLIVGSASTEDKRHFARQGGVDLAVDSLAPGWDKEILDLTGGRGVDVAFESSGASLPALLRCLSPFGTLVKFGRGVDEHQSIDPSFVIEKNQTLRGFYLPPWFAPEHADIIQAGTQDLLDGLVDGSLRIAISERFPLGRAGAAHEAIEARRSMGKLVLEPWA